MTAQQLLEVLDELERRRRRDFTLARRWLVGLISGQDGSISPLGAGPVHDGRMMPMLLDLEDVADCLQVSVSSVKRLVKAGELPVVKVEHHTRVRRCDLDAYVFSLDSTVTTGRMRRLDDLEDRAQ